MPGILEDREARRDLVLEFLLSGLLLSYVGDMNGETVRSKAASREWSTLFDSGIVCGDTVSLAARLSSDVVMYDSDNDDGEDGPGVRA